MALLTTTQMRSEYGPGCTPRTVTLALNGEGRVAVAPVAADAIRALNQVLVTFGYRTRRADTGGFNCRVVTGGTGVSPHGLGTAVDLNWTSNPYRTDGKLITDMPTAMVAAILAIRTVSGAQVFGWGGNYRTIKDAMHWEVACRRRDLESGINWSTVAKPAPAPVSFSWIPVVVIQPGDRSERTAHLQFALNCLTAFHGKPALAISSPPGYGPVTVETVRAFQTFARSMQLLAGERSEAKLIDVDGVWGPQTGTAARFWLPNAIALANTKK